MNKIFPKIFDVKVTLSILIVQFIVFFLACAGINGAIDFIGLPDTVEMILKGICTLYFVVYFLLAFLNFIGVIKVREQ